MVSAIGSSPTFSVASTPAASTAAIEAQIARDTKELANCVNCASAETKQGQADIQALSNKINVAKARLEQVAESNSSDQAAALRPSLASETAVSGVATNETDTNLNSAASITTSNIDDDSATALNASDSSTGRFVDEYV